MKKYTLALYLTVLLMANMGCQDKFLNEKPNKALLVPTTTSDFQALLDNYEIMNNAPIMGAVSCDDIYTTDAGWEGTEVFFRNTYLWQKDIYQGQGVTDWNNMYQQIFYANIVLDGLAKYNAPEVNSATIKIIKGSALFYRALAYYHLSQTFAKPFQALTADQDLGLPIKLTADINEIIKRGTLRQTYDQLINDLKISLELLPLEVSVKTRPTKQAALALLSRISLTMDNYADAINYASACLLINNKLIDYNDLVSTASRPIPSPLSSVNDEVLYYSQLPAISFFIVSTLTMIDPDLYAAYDANDLRRVMFFRDRGNGAITFKGNYSGNSAQFAGIATDEVYLNRAESFARAGNTEAALADLKTLMKKRWNNKYPLPSFDTSDSEQALKLILNERRKELVYRNLRWTDLRRLNLSPLFAKTIKRTIKGVEYLLPPNDARYVFAIPDNEINKSGIEQNAR